MVDCADDSALRELVSRYRVTWESRHEMAPRGGSSVGPVGYEVELTAVPDHPPEGVRFDCPNCTDVERALEQITAAVAPREVVHVGRGERQLSTAHGHQPEIPATVTVLHRHGHGVSEPITEELRKRRDAIVGRLRDLGAQEGHWRDR